MKRYYSLREISQELNIPKSTIVKYKDFFSEFLKMAGDGKRKKFEEEALEVLQAIREMREKQKLDWLEIKEVLCERFGAPESQEEPKQAAAPAPRIEQVAHVVNAMAGEVMRTSAMVDELQKRLKRQEKRHEKDLRILASGMRRTQKTLDMAMAGFLDQNRTLARDAADLKGITKQGLAKLLVNLQHVQEGLTAGDNKETNKVLETRIEELTGDVEKVVSEGTLFQGKYQVLLRENELLRRRLNEITTTKLQNEEMQKQAGPGFFSKFRK